MKEKNPFYCDYYLFLTFFCVWLTSFSIVFIPTRYGALLLCIRAKSLRHSNKEKDVWHTWMLYFSDYITKWVGWLACYFVHIFQASVWFIPATCCFCFLEEEGALLTGKQLHHIGCAAALLLESRLNPLKANQKWLPPRTSVYYYGIPLYVKCNRSLWRPFFSFSSGL